MNPIAASLQAKAASPSYTGAAGTQPPTLNTRSPTPSKIKISHPPNDHPHKLLVRDNRQNVDTCPGEAPTGSLTEHHVSHLASLDAAPTQTPSTRHPPSPPPPPPPPATTTPLSLGSVGEVCGDGLLCGRGFSQPDFLTILCSDGVLPNIPLLRMWWRFQQVMFDQFRGEPLPILLPTEALKSRCPISIDQIENILVQMISPDIFMTMLSGKKRIGTESDYRLSSGKYQDW